MKVLVDVRACLGPGAGANTYTRELIRALRELGVGLGMWCAGRRPERLRDLLIPELRALEPEVPLHLRKLSNQLLYSQPALAAWSRWPRGLAVPSLLPAGYDLFHAPYWPLPIERRRPVVLTIHDLIALQQPEWATPAMVAEQQAIRAIAPTVAAVIADSEATREVILAETAVRPERITVVPLGVAERYLEPIAPDAVAAVRARLGLERPYLVSLATRDPRKNLARLIDAYDRVCAREGAHWDLVLVGARGWGEDEVTPRLERPRPGHVLVTGHLPNEDLPPLLAGAAAMGYLSLAEGFGLPPLEAMAAGCPVVTSNRSSLPEVVGDAAVQVDPADVDAIADGLTRVLTQEALADGLRRRGRARAAELTWRRTAEATLAVYERVLAGR